MEIHIDFIKLLGTSVIKDDDLKTIENKINELKLFIFEKDVDITLTRIDYRFDIAIPKNQRNVLLKIYKKTFEKYKFNKKYDQYESTVYYNSKSTQLTVYDKEVERKIKNQKIEDYEKDILRYEIRLMNKHLNYLKYNYGVSKELSSYLNDDLYKKYFKKYLMPIIFIGDYYKIYSAEKIIKNSSIINDKEKDFLREFLVDVSKYGISKTKELVNNNLNENGINNEINKKYTDYKFNKALNLLKQLGINPILIPKNEKVESFIKNPLADLF